MRDSLRARFITSRSIPPILKNLASEWPLLSPHSTHPRPSCEPRPNLPQYSTPELSPSPLIRTTNPNKPPTYPPPTSPAPNPPLPRQQTPYATTAHLTHSHLTPSKRPQPFFPATQASCVYSTTPVPRAKKKVLRPSLPPLQEQTTSTNIKTPTLCTPNPSLPPARQNEAARFRPDSRPYQSQSPPPPSVHCHQGAARSRRCWNQLPTNFAGERKHTILSGGEPNIRLKIVEIWWWNVQDWLIVLPMLPWSEPYIQY